MSDAPPIPVDRNGDIVFGNPERLQQISSKLMDAHTKLNGQDKELENAKAFLVFDQNQSACPVMSGPDQDLQQLIVDATPPKFTDAAALDGAIKAVADAAFETGALAYGTGYFATTLTQADAHYRDVMGSVPELHGTLYDITADGTIAQNTATTVSFMEAEKVKAEFASQYETIRFSMGAQGHVTTVAEGATFLDNRIAGDMKNWFTEVDRRMHLDPSDPNYIPPGTSADAVRIAGILAARDGAGATGSSRASGQNDNAALETLERVGNYSGRQLQDIYGAVPRQIAGVASFGGHAVAGTADFAWDAVFGVGRAVKDFSVMPTVDFVGTTLVDTGHFLTGHNGMTFPDYAGAVAGNAGDAASDAWYGVAALADEQWDNAYDFGETILGRGYDAAYTGFDATRDALNPFD